MFLTEIEHPDGTGYFGLVLARSVPDAKIWTGCSRLAGVTPITYNGPLNSGRCVLASSVSESDVARLSSDVRGYYGTLWIACLADDEEVVPIRAGSRKCSFDYAVYRLTMMEADIGIISQPHFINQAID